MGQAAEIVATGKQPGLEDFLRHVRSLMLRTSTTRREALLSLKSLTETFAVQGDCHTLSSRLKQLFGQIFPPVTTKASPCTKLEAMERVAGLLKHLRYQSIRIPMCKAWRDCTTYDTTTLWRDYLRESLHTDQERSEKLSKQFLARCCEMLEEAHLQYLQDTTRHVPQSDKGSPGAAKKRSAKVLALGTSAGSKRGRSASTGRFPKGTRGGKVGGPPGPLGTAFR